MRNIHPARILLKPIKLAYVTQVLEIFLSHIMFLYGSKSIPYRYLLTALLAGVATVALAIFLGIFITLSPILAWSI